MRFFYLINCEVIRLIELKQGDCLIESSEIKSGSVDLILTDLPYGTMKNAKLDGWEKQTTAWDEAIKPEFVFKIANRILRKNGKIVLFSQEPYTANLITEAIPNVPFSYRMIWEKDHFANSLVAKKAPVSYYEDILIFSKMNPIHGCEFTHPLRPYFKRVMDFIGLNKKQIIGEIGQCADHVFRTESSQFGLCTEQTYNKLISVFEIDKMQGFKEFKDLSIVDEPFKKGLSHKKHSLFPSTFNLWEGNKYKSNILKYKKDYGGLHPTQKPVLLLEDLIKTFSNENDLVVDLTMGSGSTAIASINTGRFFIGIEKDEGYYNIAKKRIDEHMKNHET